MTWKLPKHVGYPYNMFYTNPWMLALGHYSGCTYTFANDIRMTYLNYHDATIFCRWFVFWIMSLFLTRCIASFFIYHVIVNIIKNLTWKKNCPHHPIVEFSSNSLQHMLSHYLWLRFSESQNPRCVIGKGCQHRQPNIANFKINYSSHKPKPKHTILASITSTW